MIRLLSGDARDVLPTLPAESVQCVVTSPPYYGLRDYGTALWDGGDAACDHTSAKIKGRADYGFGDKSQVQTTNVSAGYSRYKDECACGAVRVDRQIGLEATPEAYLATMVGVFREIRRVMRNDAVAFINMGDSYSDKQLLLMPARLALALQADGWWVRSDIIWHKPNPMPESCTDRCTSAHEHVFMLTKASRYYFDAEAIRETAEYGRSGGSGAFRSSKYVGSTSYDNGADVMAAGAAIPGNGGSRNARSVWTIATHAYPEAHFATFPPELAERCIKAGTSERGCCAVCGKPWVRVVKKSGGTSGQSWHNHSDDVARGQRGGDNGHNAAAAGWKDYNVTTIGWRPFCSCCRVCDEQMLSCNPAKGHEPAPYPTVPCTVLDPFIGAGTTALVADRLQRDCIGIDLNVAYTRMAMDRCVADAPLFTSFAPAEDPEDERMADLFAGMAAD